VHRRAWGILASPKPPETDTAVVNPTISLVVGLWVLVVSCLSVQVDTAGAATNPNIASPGRIVPTATIQTDPRLGRG